MTTCSSCGAEIMWARTENDRPIPLDVESHPDGNIKLLAGRAVIGGLQLLDPGPRYVAHFATCLNASSHRRTRGAQA